MKRFIVLLFTITLLLSGCGKTKHQASNGCINVEISCDVSDISDDACYIYSCDMTDCLDDVNVDEHIAVTTENMLTCDGKEICDIYNTGIYSEDGKCKLLQCKLELLDANYEAKTSKELLSYLEAYLSELQVFSNGSSKETTYEIRMWEHIYILKEYNGKCYLIPVVRIVLLGYGEIYLEVNSGCIIW